MKIDQNFRDPTSTEKGIIQRLLTAEFPGRKAIASQLSDYRVRTLDDDGSFEIEPSSAAEAASVEKRIPVEAEAVDNDGVHVHFLLHVDKGFVKELEVYKDDGSPISRQLSPNELEVTVLPA